MERGKLERRLKRLQGMRDELKNKHCGNEENYTYYGGYDLGYLEGKIAVLEEWLDELEEIEDYRSGFKTNDGKYVTPGDVVWVLSSMGEVVDTRVQKGSTGYVLYSNPIQVKDSFSSKEAAEEYLKEVRG